MLPVHCGFSCVMNMLGLEPANLIGAYHNIIEITAVSFRLVLNIFRMYLVALVYNMQAYCCDLKQ